MASKGNVMTKCIWKEVTNKDKLLLLENSIEGVYMKQWRKHTTQKQDTYRMGCQSTLYSISNKKDKLIEASLYLIKIFEMIGPMGSCHPCKSKFCCITSWDTIIRKIKWRSGMKYVASSQL